MALTSIADRKTPSRPIELTFEAEQGIPSGNQNLIIIGHKDAASGSIAPYAVTTISNSGDLTAGTQEAITKFGAGSELAKMVVAAIKANQGQSSLPTIRCIPLASTDTDFGASDAALTTLDRLRAEFVVSPYNGLDATLRTKLRDQIVAMNGANRVDQDQCGSFGVVLDSTEVDPDNLPTPDSLALICISAPDTATGPDENAYSEAERCAAAAARIAAGAIPFMPLDNVSIPGYPAPAIETDWVTVGANLESEAILNKGWTPLRVKTNGDVAFVRTVTSRLFQSDGVTAVTAYYDVQDFQVLYYWRRVLKTRVSQPDFTNVKASAERARALRGEMVRLAMIMQEQNMFQSVTEFVKEFVVERSATDRHRFDFKTPVNVIPGLHVIAGNIAASTRFDTITV